MHFLYKQHRTKLCTMLPWLVLITLPWAHTQGLQHSLAALLLITISWPVEVRIKPVLRSALLFGLIALVTSLQKMGTHLFPLAIKELFWSFLVPLAGFACAATLDVRQNRAMQAISMVLTLIFVLFITGAALFWSRMGVITGESASGFWRFYPGPGISSTLLLLSMPLVLTGLGDHQPLLMRLSRHHWALLALLATTWGGWLTGNREFWLGWMLVLLVTLHALSRRKRHGQLLLLITAILGFSLAVGMIRHQTHVRTDLHGFATITHDNRLIIWQYWLKQIPNAPWMGHGYGKAVQRAYYRQDQHLQNPVGIQVLIGTHAHNVLLDTWIQTGLFGVLGWLLLQWKLAHPIEVDPSIRQAASLLVVLMLLKNATDDFMDFQVPLFYCLQLGLIWSSRRPTDPAPDHPKAQQAQA